MQSVGSQLREAREKKGFSLDQINARTRINFRNLIAIEEDEVSSIGSPFFYRSFVRQFAETVDLDFQILAPAVEMLAANMRQPDLPGQGEYLRVRGALAQPRPKNKWFAPAMVLLLVVASGSGLFAAIQYFRPLVHAATLPPVTPEQNPTPLQGTQQSASTASSVVPSPVPSPVPPSAESASDSDSAKAGSIHLKLVAIERTWLSITADGKPAYQGILEPDQTKVLDSQQAAKLRTGNAGGVVITFNGKDIGPIGLRGQTRTVVFTNTGYEVKRSQPAFVSDSHIGG